VPNGPRRFFGSDFAVGARPLENYTGGVSGDGVRTSTDAAPAAIFVRKRPPRCGRECLGGPPAAGPQHSQARFDFPLIEIAKAKGVCAYVGEGRNRFPAGHLSDVALLYRLAIERGEPGARYNAVGEEGVEARTIAEALGRGLNMQVISLAPEKAAAFRLDGDVLRA
jgi:nucleoside-diphosphate-sugar epimerase